ncbi:MAG: RpiB/LacA/LacB family sugar-phosphate isomerase [Candidatus Pacebacteria bacterium]|nr:RpiB/LacA/LacB family sugar-phosphate isomerase [Candidatus Paceibacterota bacterium]
MREIGIVSYKPKIYIGTDHAGFVMKEKLIPYIEKLGYEVIDFGNFKYDDTDDYIDFVSPVAKAVALNPEDNRGIILGGSGQGEAIVANRFPNIRAIVYYGEAGFFPEADIIKLGREHNNSNILSLGARFLNIETAQKVVKKWLETKFTNEERHIRRIKKIETVSRDVKNNLEFK